MFLKRMGLAALAFAAATATSACNEGYGYGGINAGYGAGYGAGYLDPYYGDYYGAGYGSGFGSYFGWYGDYYYPGTGIYVYDRYRRPFRWNDGQRRYWEARRGRYGRDGIRDNWNGFGRRDWGDGRRFDGRRFDGRGPDRPRIDGTRPGDGRFDGRRYGYRGRGTVTPGTTTPPVPPANGLGVTRPDRNIYRGSRPDRGGSWQRGPAPGAGSTPGTASPRSYGGRGGGRWGGGRPRG